MLNTRKLLYILPDVAYIAELLPAKKEHTFTVQAFRQINGEFFNQDEEEFIAENIEKLFAKIEPENYYLVLPDFLFTNTILEVHETNENKVKDYIKDDLLPKLELSKETHEIETFSLTQYNGATKIQLTALERSVLDPIVLSSQAHNVTIEHISPLTWTIKSIISLEPSISVLQIGSLVYVAEHYIGVDQCTFCKVEEIENVVDTIKTLKGSQPSIQTVYLLTNSLVEQKLKEHVSSTLPLQQLTNVTEEDSQMPSYVKQIIESGMKTLDIPDFPVPSFTLPKHPVGSSNTAQAVKPAVAPVEKAEESLPLPKAPELAAPALSSLPTPKPVMAMPAPAAPMMAAVAATLPALEAPTMTSITTHRDSIDIEEDDGEPEISAHSEDVTTQVVTSPFNSASATVTPFTQNQSEMAKPETPAWMSTSGASSVYVPPASPQLGSLTENADSNEGWGETLAKKPDARPTSDSLRAATVSEAPAWKSTPSNFQSESLDSVGSVRADDSIIAKIAGKRESDMDNTFDDEPSVTEPLKVTKPIIKNKDGNSNLVKMAFVSLAVFALTVAIGVGVGFGILSLNNRSQTAELPSPLVTATPSSAAVVSPVTSPVPSPIDTSSATVSKKSKILVVNATTTPGYAGTTASKLKTAGYTQVSTGNAKGTYDPGFYVLTTKADPATTQALSDASGLALTSQTTKSIEDPSNVYDAVVVLAK